MQAIIIQDTNERPGGSKHGPMPSGKVYHFKPTADDERHLAAVSDKRDLDRFLRIDTFVIADVEEEPQTQGLGVMPPPQTDHTGSEDPGGSESAAGGDGGDGAQAHAGVVPSGTQEDKPSSQHEPQNLAPAAPQTKTTDPFAKLSDEQIAAVFETEVGRKPRANAKRETLIGQIEAARREKTSPGQ